MFFFGYWATILDCDSAVLKKVKKISMTSNVLSLHFAPSQASSSQNSNVDDTLEGYRIKSDLLSLIKFLDFKRIQDLEFKFLSNHCYFLDRKYAHSRSKIVLTLEKKRIWLVRNRIMRELVVSNWCSFSHTKGELILDWLFDVLNFPKNQHKNLMNFCPRI